MENISSFQTQSLDTAMQHLQSAQSKNLNADTKNLDKINEKAKEFEAVFLSQMLSHMFEGVETDGPFGGGSSEKIYRSMMVNEYGKQLSKDGNIGIADEVAKFMLDVQEQANGK